MAEMRVETGGTIDVPMKELRDRRVRTLVKTGNGVVTIPKGTVMRVTGWWKGTVGLEGPPCGSCGIQARISRVPRCHVELLIEHEDPDKENPLVRFIEMCREVARENGDRGFPITGTCFQQYYDHALTYADGRVRILADRDLPSLEVEMLTPHHNPVICIDRGGAMYRTHGEWRMIKDHIEGLVEA